MSTFDEDDLPGGPIRTLSDQRVSNIVMNPDGSISKRAPPPPPLVASPHIKLGDAALDAAAGPDPETSGAAAGVAAPTEHPELGEDAPPVPPPQLLGLPIAADAVAESTVTKDAIDDERVHDVRELTDKGHSLQESKPLINNIPKEDVWALVRRFDKQIYHVRVVDPNAKARKTHGKLDLETSDEDEFAPDKLRSQLERFYLTVVLSMIGFAKHMARISNWTDVNRSAAFATVYFVAWFFNLLVPALFTLLAVLIMVPPTRKLLFPPITHLQLAEDGLMPAPPKAGEKISTDTATGAPEAAKGEAAEQEATNFFASIGILAVGLGTGGGPTEKNMGHSVNSDDGAVPDPAESADRMTDALPIAGQGRKHRTEHDKTKAPVQNAVFESAKPVMQAVNQLCDTWERLANALSPTPPFHKNRVRARLGALMVPVIVLFPLLSYDVMLKSVAFAMGAGFFGQLWLVEYGKRGLDWLNTNYPDWPEMLDLGRTLLRGVPTNAQLTLTLLRLGEAAHDPLPPPPGTAPPASGTSAPPAKQGHGPRFDKDDSDASSGEDYEGLHPTEAAQGHESAPKTASKGAKARIAGLLRGTAKLGAGALEVTHRVEAATVGGAKDKVGVLPPSKARVEASDGPSAFSARHAGKKGHVVLDTAEGTGGAAHADIVFVRGRRSREEVRIPLTDVAEVRKVGGLGWKGRLIAGWALGEDIPDGLEITTRDGTMTRFTAVPRRDELFDRLISMGSQRWESC